MPEGPECTRTARQVNRAVQGKELVNLNFISGRYTKKLPDKFADFYIALEEKHLPVKGVYNKGKFIWWEFGDLLPICYMYTTLGMTGNFKLQPSKHTRIAFYFDDDSAIYYNDQRNFGTIKFVFDDKDHQKKLILLVLICSIILVLYPHSWTLLTESPDGQWLNGLWNSLRYLVWEISTSLNHSFLQVSHLIDSWVL